MEDKLFCTSCSMRIWRACDGRKFVDQYFEDRHFNCGHSLAWRPPLDKITLEVDNSWKEVHPNAVAKG